MLKDANINESVLKLKGLDALKEIADGRATKIYMPSDISSAVASLGVISESLGIGDAMSIDMTERPEYQPAPDTTINETTSGEGVMTSETAQKIKEDI